jgi:hypothetical protein
MSFHQIVVEGGLFRQTEVDGHKHHAFPSLIYFALKSARCQVIFCCRALWLSARIEFELLELNTIFEAEIETDLTAG